MAPRAKTVKQRLLRVVSRARSRVDSALGRKRKTQVVICGFPRSGTSLLYNMLASTLAGFHYDEFEHSALGYVREYRDTLSKRPLDVFKIGDLARSNRLGKRLVVIVLIRDLRDVLTSRHPRVPDDYFIGYDACYRVDGPSGPERIHPGIGAIAEELERLERLPGIELFTVRFEDLVVDPDAAQAELAERTGLPIVGHFSDFHTTKRLAYRYEGEREALAPELVREDRPVDSARAGKWRGAEHAARIRGEFGAHPELFELLERYGYETDDDWFAPYRSEP